MHMIRMPATWQTLFQRFPRPFWVMINGTVINRIGESMIWPILTVYMREQLGIAVALITTLLTIEAISAIISTSFTGIGVDRFGRKQIMLISLLSNSVLFLAMLSTTNLYIWGVILIAKGAVNPMYRVGARAAVTDLVEEDNRAQAYAIMRTAANIGVTIGPVIGGLLIFISYAPLFIGASLAMLLFAILIYRYVPETIPQEAIEEQEQGIGYGMVLKDRRFLAYCSIYVFTVMPYILLFTLLPVYMKDEFSISESVFGLMLTMNAAMVVMFQFGTTRLVDRFHPLFTLMMGTVAAISCFGVIVVSGSVELFVLSMVFLTIAEMLMMPTSMTYAANLAPTAQRGRYMGVYSLTWGFGQALGLSIGGFLNDAIAPVAVWYGAVFMNVIALAGFTALWWADRRQVPQPQAPALAPSVG